MAGSIRKFDYTSDDGTVYVIKRDESNTETVNTPDEGEPPTNAVSTDKYPKEWEPRYALLYKVDEPIIKRKVTILTPAIFAALQPDTDFSLDVVGAAPANFRISALIGERRLDLVTADTGQDDGDNDEGGAP